MASPAAAPDTSRWPTLTEAAVILATNERTIRRWIDAGRLHSAMRPAPGRKPLTILNPEDVERLRIERQPPVLIRDVARDAPGNSDVAPHAPDSKAVGPHVPPDAAAMQHFLAGVLQAFPIRRPKLFMTLDEAAEYCGMPKSWLLRRAPELAINVGTEKRVLWRFSRPALVALAKRAMLTP